MVKVEIPTLLSEGDVLGLIKKVTGVDAEETTEVGAFVLWLVDSYEKIIDMEAKALKSSPNKKMVDAGIERLNVFGELNVINSLAGGDILKYEEIKKLPYEDVFNKLLMDKIEREVYDEYSRIMSNRGSNSSEY